MTEIELWLRTQGDTTSGLRLLEAYAPSPRLSRLVSAHPDKYGHLLRERIEALAPQAVVAASARSFRDEWPFLGEPDCPMELKALAADKITAYREFARLHERLFSCETPEQCLETAKNAVENWYRNRNIASEFEYYREHHAILGKHPIFAESRRREELQGMDPLELARREAALKRSIARMSSRVRKGDRPDLDGDRTDLIDARRRELAEVQRMIQNYRTAHGK